jgi:hypothetical protein
VDLDARSVVGYGVTSEPEDDPAAKMGTANLLGIVRLYDVQTGKRLITGPMVLIPPEPVACPPDTFYWDQVPGRTGLHKDRRDLSSGFEELAVSS